MIKVYIGLGSNLKNKSENIKNALAKIKISKNICEIKSAGIYRSQPVGFKSSNSFLNTVISCKTDLNPESLLKLLKNIEKSMGRKQKSDTKDYRDRIIDLDILIYGNKIINQNNMVIPHPQLKKRLFVLIPLVELEPELKHPETGKLLASYISPKLKSDQKITKINELI